METHTYRVDGLHDWIPFLTFAQKQFSVDSVGVVGFNNGELFEIYICSAHPLNSPLGDYTLSEAVVQSVFGAHVWGNVALFNV